MAHVGIIGYGYVGRHTAAILSQHHRVSIYDPASHPERLSGLDVAVICVPTPMAADGSCDTSIVESEAELSDAPVVVVRSTVVPGTCEAIAERTGKVVAFVPEFIVARTGEDPGAGYWIIGGDCPSWLLPERDGMMRLSLREAETVKYLLNCYFATKVVFAYEVAGVCEALGVDYRRVLEAASLDERLDPDHLQIIGSPGAGGPCLPKDLSAFVELGRRGLGLPMSVLSAVRAENDRLLAR